MKIRAHKVGRAYTDDGKFVLQCEPEDVGFMRAEMQKHKETTLLSVDITQYKPRRTKRQNGLFWKAFDFYAKHMGINGTTDRYFLYEGFKRRFALHKDSGVVDDKGDMIRVAIGLSECNRFEQFAALFEGLWVIMAEEGIDYSPFLKAWEDYKQEQKEAVT